MRLRARPLGASDRSNRFQSVELRDYVPEDIPLFLAYWHDCDSSHVSDMGVCQNRLPSPEAMAKALSFALDRHATDPQSHPLRIVAIRYEGRTVGFHQLTDISVDHRHASMHAYFIDPACRGRGLGVVSYAKAMALFFDRFALREIVFDTPLNNTAALRIKAALGIQFIGDTVIDQPFLQSPLNARRFRVTFDEMPALLCRAKGDSELSMKLGDAS